MTDVSIAQHIPVKSYIAFHLFYCKHLDKLSMSQLILVRQSSRISSKDILVIILNNYLRSINISPLKLFQLSCLHSCSTFLAMVVCLKCYLLIPHLNLSSRVVSTQNVQLARVQSLLIRFLAIQLQQNANNYYATISGLAQCRHLYTYDVSFI